MPWERWRKANQSLPEFAVPCGRKLFTSGKNTRCHMLQHRIGKAQEAEKTLGSYPASPAYLSGLRYLVSVGNKVNRQQSLTERRMVRHSGQERQRWGRCGVTLDPGPVW